jgi:hypothetical protein
VQWQPAVAPGRTRAGQPLQLLTGAARERSRYAKGRRGQVTGRDPRGAKLGGDGDTEYMGAGVPDVEAWREVARMLYDALAVLRVERIRREMAGIGRSGVRVKLRPWRWHQRCSPMEQCGGGQSNDQGAACTRGAQVGFIEEARGRAGAGRELC